MIILQRKPSSALGPAFIWREARALLRARRSPCYHRFVEVLGPARLRPRHLILNPTELPESEDSPNRLRGRGALNELVGPVPAMISSELCHTSPTWALCRAGTAAVRNPDYVRN
jgi:hypothetical protein